MKQNYFGTTLLVPSFNAHDHPPCIAFCSGSSSCLCLFNFHLSAFSRGSQNFTLIEWFCQTPILYPLFSDRLGEENMSYISMCVCVCVSNYVCVHSILLCFSPSSKPLPGMFARPPKKSGFAGKAVIIINQEGKATSQTGWSLLLLQHATAEQHGCHSVKIPQLLTIYSVVTLLRRGSSELQPTPSLYLQTCTAFNNRSRQHTVYSLLRLFFFCQDIHGAYAHFGQTECN